MQVITAEIEEESHLIYERTGKLLILREGLVVTEPVAQRLSERLEKV